MAQQQLVGKRKVDDGDDDVQFIGSKRKLDDSQDIDDICLDADFSQGANHGSKSKWRRTDAGKATPDHHRQDHSNDHGVGNNNNCCAGLPRGTPTLFTPAALKATREEQTMQMMLEFGRGSASVEASAGESQARYIDRTNERLREIQEDLRKFDERLRADQERLDEAREKKKDAAEDARRAVEHVVHTDRLLTELQQRSAESAMTLEEAAASVQNCTAELDRQREQAASLGAAKSAYIDTLPAAHREEQAASNAARELDGAYVDAVAAVLRRRSEIEREGLASAAHADWLDSSLRRSRDRLLEHSEELGRRGELSPQDVPRVQRAVSDAVEQSYLGRREWPGACAAWGVQARRDEHVPRAVQELRREEEAMLRAVLELEARRLRHEGVAGRVARFSAMQHAAGHEIERCEALLASLTEKEELARVREENASYSVLEAQECLLAAILEEHDVEKYAADAAAEEEGVQSSVDLSKEARDEARAAVDSVRQELIEPM